MENTNTSRRRFFAQLLGMTGVVAIAPALLKLTSANAQEKRRSAAPAASGGAMPMVDLKDPAAKAVKYVEDAKQSPESKGNHCGTCGFYKKTEMRAGKEVGTCTIFAGKLVHAEGWCASWNKKA
jgi:hypothetical protein